MNTQYSSRGIALLLLVIVVGSVSFLMVFRGLWRGIIELDSAVTYERGRETFSITDGCLEEALRRIDLDANYAGEANVPLLGGSCTITVVPSGASRTITITGRTSDAAFTNTLIATVTLTADSIVMNSWQAQE